MNTKISFDFKSIRFKLWAYFILFAVIILGLVWLLQVYFLDAYYEDMKLKKSERMASELVNAFNEDYSLESFSLRLNEISQGSDTYVRVETGDGRIVISPSSQSFLYRSETNSLRLKLLDSEFPSYSEIIPGSKDTKTLTYARFLHKATDKYGNLDAGNSLILYMFSPLFPVRSTISILRRQLTYITIIALLLALSLAIYLATRISKPIRNITESAAEMGRGNYGVPFKGGHYTEITELAETLTEASQELEKSDMYQKDLIANVSHDLKTPLTMIKSYAEMIRDLSGDNKEKRESHLSVIIDEADRLNLLVDDMLTMSKMQQQKIALEKSDFDLDESIRTQINSYDILAEQEGYKFKYESPGTVIINGDEAKIRQVIANLVNNAVKYCGDDKEIIVSLKPLGKKVRCEVTDHGQGIAPDEINHVWERYYKSSTHHVRPTEGSGLGLSIVKEILTLHRADYGVDSKLGRGTTFWFELKTK
ncbi:MAG: HAMP domain-containing histidine kinase [Firmicutes bacterium]|nr:HAMP domain-containing histidine kinase [Bacillota bacterium]